MIKKTIKIPLFWKIYIIVVTIVLIGFVVLWSILWTALKKYEQSRPEYAMDKITEQIQLQDTGDFTKYVHTGENAYEGSEALDEAVREYIKNVLCEGAWAYTKKSGEYTNDNPVYQLKKDGQSFDKYDIDVDKVYFDASYNITLYMGDVKVSLGSSKDFTDRLFELKQLSSRFGTLKGTLYLDDYNGDESSIIFKREK